MRGPASFYFDFFAFPALAILLFAVFCRSWEFVGLAGVGAMLFTLTEYWVHRAALHRLFYHGTHERHHDHPEEYVAFPIWATPTAFAVFYFVMPLPVFAGFVVGFCWFIYWHHILHHFDLTVWPRFVQRYATWHLGHHRFNDRNFGICVPIWDFVFGTYRHSR